jgi:RNA polymerase sigma-70 factor (ECF subfamily)
MCKNEYRRNEVRRAMKPEWVNGKDADYIRQDLDYRTLQGELEKLLVQANEDDRSLFIMRYEVELTLPEIAAIIEIPQGTVKSRLHYLKKRLSERLQAFNPAIN